MRTGAFLLPVIFAPLIVMAGTTGIHERELAAHRSLPPLVLYDAVAIVPRETPAPILTKRMFGYLPYWTNDTEYLRYPLLTDIAFFSCELGANGALGECHGWPAAAPIAEAHGYGVKVHLVVTGFDKTTVLDLVKSGTQKATFFAETYAKVHEAGTDGLNIDFEISSGDDSAVIAQFFNDLADYFHSRDEALEVSAALWAVDWQDTFAIGSMTQMDLFFVMAYDYHWKGGEPGPVSPLISQSPWPTGGICVTRSYDDYATKLGGTGLERLVLGFPYYGYDWPTTSDTVPGTKTANAVAALYENIDMGGEIYDDGSKTVYKAYNSGGWHQLWFDTPTTFAEKLAFVKDNPSGGAGIWALNYDGAGDEFWHEIARAFTDAVPGSTDDPITVTTFPFAHDGNTYRYRSDSFDAYTCDNQPDSAAINEEGPEIVYELTIDTAGTLTATLTAGAGEAATDREDIDLHLLRTLSPDDCLTRAHVSFTEHLAAGTYYLVADSYVTAEGVRKGGPYRVEMIFSPDETPDGGAPDTDTLAGDDTDELLTDDIENNDALTPSDTDLPAGPDTVADSEEANDDTLPDETTVPPPPAEGCGCSLTG
ncbi:MAG TPA: glycosyl hydrolase family 18 protein [bacterium]|nr:glycosyl hydrolase family 18 protein [bacterium]